MSIYDNNKELLSALGVEGNYSTDFEVRKAILNALGGDASACNSIYEVDLEILRIYQEGGGGGDISLPEQIKSIICNEDGTYTVTPDEGYTLSRVEIEVNVGGSWQVPDGTVFKSSTFTTVSGLDTSNVTTFNKMFYDCINLTEIPQLNTSNGTNFNGMFSGCSKLTEIPQLNTSNGTNFGNMFNNCSNLTTIPQLDTSNGTGFLNMFGSCSKLTTIPQLNISKSTILGNMFNNCASLKNITFTGSINANIGFSPCTLITYESVKSILTACSNTTNTNSKTVTFKRTLTDQNGELAALIATCTSKGWTVSGLTLE